MLVGGVDFLFEVHSLLHLCLDTGAGDGGVLLLLKHLKSHKVKREPEPCRSRRFLQEEQVGVLSAFSRERARVEDRGC